MIQGSAREHQNQGGKQGHIQIHQMSAANEFL
jgi:hypothetical protein